MDVFGFPDRQRITTWAMVNVTLNLLFPMVIGNRCGKLVGYIVPELKFIRGDGLNYFSSIMV